MSYKTIQSKGTLQLCTFSINIQKRHLNSFYGMVSKVTFPNTKHTHIQAVVSKQEYDVTTEDSISFALPNFGRLTRGQLLQQVATGTANTKTKSEFPTFCNGSVSSQYLNMARIDGLDLVGLPDDAPLTLECYTILENGKPLW